jgi:hypothetical protein
MSNLTHLSTRDVADLLVTEEWRIRRLFELGILTEPGRFAGKRAIPKERLPEIIDALRAKGWLPPPRLPQQQAADADSPE